MMMMMVMVIITMMIVMLSGVRLPPEPRGECSRELQVCSIL